MESDRPVKEVGTFLTLPKTYGTSVLGNALEIWLPASAECDLLFIGGIHGEEPETTVLLSRALRSMNAPPERAAVIACANPDGLIRGTRGNANGVDLNRNFPASNWKPDPVTHRWTLEKPDTINLSPGDSPSSEPETRALIEQITRLDPEHMIAMHAPLACIDDPEASPLGQSLADATGLPLVPDVGYPTPGSLGSWAAQNQRHVITYELEIAGIEPLIDKHVPILRSLITRGTVG